MGKNFRAPLPCSTMPATRKLMVQNLERVADFHVLRLGKIVIHQDIVRSLETGRRRR